MTGVKGGPRWQRWHQPSLNHTRAGEGKEVRATATYATDATPSHRQGKSTP
jgi:hypothetical protein